MTSPNERVTLNDALEFLKRETGYDFERRTFLRWCEAGVIEINEQQIEIETAKVGGLWYLTRASLEVLRAFLQPQ